VNTPPGLVLMAQVRCEVGAVQSLGVNVSGEASGERRWVPLTGGTVSGPELQGRIVEGGVDWQLLRADGVLEISAHYVVATDDGAFVEVTSKGLRHGPPEVMARLARGEAVAPDEYFFRTQMRFATGHPVWLHLNKVMALAVGQREAGRVLLDVWRIT
jgi:Protein of unknown function (DUF3237)